MKQVKDSPSRQQVRHELREEALREINQRAGGEPRRVRRDMARVLGNRRYTGRSA